MADRSALSWLQDRTVVRAHMKSHQIDRQLKAGGGFARVTGFLPPAVAAEAHRLLTEHSSWECMHDGEVNDRADSIAHSFQFAEPEDHPQTLGVLADAVAMLFEELVPSFSVASYGRGDSIAPHDDKAHVEVEPEGGGRPVLHSRKYAGIYYLSRGWKAKYGGALVDLEGRAEHVPSFNTLVVFQVPRMHGVAPVLVDGRPRLSLFGWWLAPGRLYDLDEEEEESEEEDDEDDDEEEEGEEEEEPRGARRGAAGASSGLQKRGLSQHRAPARGQSRPTPSRSSGRGSAPKRRK